MKESIDTGGPAFANCGAAVDGINAGYNDGMTLLDWFAGQAMSQLANTAAMERLWAEVGDDLPERIAATNYKIAAAMIAEKRRREGEQ